MHWKHAWQSQQHFCVAIKWSKLVITLVLTIVLTNIFIYDNVQYFSIICFIGANVLTDLMYTFLKILFHFVSINFVDSWNSKWIVKLLCLNIFCCKLDLPLTSIIESYEILKHAIYLHVQPLNMPHNKNHLS
jgi:hypothetical protein